MPGEVADRIIDSGLLDDPDVAIAVGRVDGVPVTTALLARSGNTAGVYNVATLPDRRAKGYGEAATWAVISEGARRGCTPLDSPSERGWISRVPADGFRRRRKVRAAGRPAFQLTGR